MATTGISVGTTTQFGNALLTVDGDIALQDNYIGYIAGDGGLRFGNNGLP